MKGGGRLKSPLLFCPLALLKLLLLERASRAERRGEELHSLRSIRKAPLLSSLPFPIFVMGHSSAFGAVLLLFLRSFKTQNNTTIDMPAMPTMMPLNRLKKLLSPIQRPLLKRSMLG